MLEWLWPWVFCAAPLPWLLRALLPTSPSRQAALNISFLDELESLHKSAFGGPWHSWRRHLPLVIVWLLLLTAAARPQWLDEARPQPITGRDMLLAVDYSGSMDIDDMRWEQGPISRLALVKRLFGAFIEERRGDRVGLILFGTHAYLQAPLTFDRRTVATWLREAPSGIAGQNTAIGDAIGLAVKRLQDNPAEQRVLLLITDGADNGSRLTPRIAAQLAASKQIKIYSVGVGADNDPSNQLFPGFQPGGQLDEPLLREIAQKTGGRYFRARTKEDLQAIGERLDQLEPSLKEATPALIGQPLYSWPLGLALLISVGLSLVRLRRRSAIAEGLPS